MNVGGFCISNRYMHTCVVGSMKTDEVLKEAPDYSSDCLHNFNNCSSFFLLQKYYDYSVKTKLFNEPQELYNERLLYLFYLIIDSLSNDDLHRSSYSGCYRGLR